MIKTSRFDYWCFPHSPIEKLQGLESIWGPSKLAEACSNQVWTAILIHDDNEWNDILKAIRMNSRGWLYEWGSKVVIYTNQINEEEIYNILMEYGKKCYQIK